MHKLVVGGLLVVLVLIVPAASASLPPGPGPPECGLYPSIRNASAGYDAGSVMYIDYSNSCSSALPLSLKWPSGAVAKQWTIAGSSSGTATYQIPPYAFSGTWTAVGIDWTGNPTTSSTTIRSLTMPATGRYVPLGEDEAVVVDYVDPSSTGTFSLGDFHA